MEKKFRLKFKLYSLIPIKLVFFIFQLSSYYEYLVG